MIDYVEVRNEALDVIGIIDTAQSVIWHSVFHGVGDFQIFVSLADALPLLEDAVYITRTDNEEVGVIESMLIADDVESGKMITLSGRFAKSLLDRRIIYSLKGKSNKAAILSGNVETALRKLITDNTSGNRGLGILSLGAVTGINKTIVDESGASAQKQVSFDSLLTYTEAVLKEYGIASKVVRVENRLQYVIYAGADRSAENIVGNQPIVFSRDFDSLLSSEYSTDSTQEKNVVLVGGEGEGIDRFCVMAGRTSLTGLARKEVFVNASSTSRKYKDDSDVEQTYTEAEYTKILTAQGMQAISAMKVSEDFHGEIDIENGNWKLGEDVFLGDIVTVQDTELGIYTNVRIAEVTEYQDQNGYTVEAVYQGE